MLISVPSKSEKQRHTHVCTDFTLDVENNLNMTWTLMFSFSFDALAAGPLFLFKFPFVVFLSFCCCPVFGCFLVLDKLQLQESLTNFSSMLWFVAFELFICVVDWLRQRSCFSFPFHCGWFYLLRLIVHHYKLECCVKERKEKISLLSSRSQGLYNQNLTVVSSNFWPFCYQTLFDGTSSQAGMSYEKICFAVFKVTAVIQSVLASELA